MRIRLRVVESDHVDEPRVVAVHDGASDEIVVVVPRVEAAIETREGIEADAEIDGEGG